MNVKSSYTLQVKLRGHDYLLYVEEYAKVTYYTLQRVGWSLPSRIDKVSNKLISSIGIRKYVESLFK